MLTLFIFFMEIFLWREAYLNLNMVKSIIRTILFLFSFLKIYLVHWLFTVALELMLWHVGSRDQTQAPHIGIAESYPLDHQGSLRTVLDETWAEGLAPPLSPQFLEIKKVFYKAHLEY